MSKTALLLVSLFFLRIVAFGQDDQQKTHATKFGIKFGYNRSVLSASINSEGSYKGGFNIGMYLRGPLSEKVFLRPELYISGQGQQSEYFSGGQSRGSTTTKLTYLNVPFLFEFGRKVNFHTGPQAGLRFSGKETGKVNNQSIDDNIDARMKLIDFSWVFGAGFNADDHWNFGARLNLGLSPALKKPSNVPSDFPSIKNRVFHFYVGYTF